MEIVKCLVPVSGGKDSQVSLKLAIKKFGVESVRGLFCDTQFEHPTNYAHIEAIKALYGVTIDTVCAGNVPDKVRKYGRFPSWAARFCTDELKIRPTIVYARELAKSQKAGFEIWYGMRSDESPAREKRYAGKVSDELYAPNDFMSKYPKYLSKLGVSVRLPIVDWSEKDVFGLLDGDENPLYDTFDRVGCFPCLASGDEHKKKAFEFDDFGKKQKVIAIKLEQEIGKSVWTSKGGAFRDRQMCMFCQI